MITAVVKFQLSLTKPTVQSTERLYYRRTWFMIVRENITANVITKVGSRHGWQNFTFADWNNSQV